MDDIGCEVSPFVQDMKVSIKLLIEVIWIFLRLRDLDKGV